MFPPAAAAAKPASTVVLLRPSASRFDVFLLRRHDEIAFMGGAHVFPGGRVDEADRHDDPAMRHRLAAVRELHEEAGVTLGIDALTPFAHWVTPVAEMKRFDTWFYAVRAPSDQVAACDGRETVDAEWIAPAEILRMEAAGERTVIFPTRMNVQLLSEAESAADCVERAQARTLVTVLPKVEKRGEERYLVLPLDAGYGDIAEPMSRIGG